MKQNSEKYGGTACTGREENWDWAFIVSRDVSQYMEVCWNFQLGKCVSKTKNQDSRLEIYTEREVAMLTLFMIDWYATLFSNGFNREKMLISGTLFPFY